MSRTNGNKPSPNGRRPRVDRDVAFAFYLSLGASRTYRRVAAEFHVSEKTVGKWARDENWPEKAAADDAEAAAKRKAKVVRSLAERDADTIRVTDSLRLSLLEEDAIASMTPYERGRLLARLLRHERLIEGQPTDRVEVIAVVERDRALQEAFVGAAMAVMPPHLREAFLQEWERRLAGVPALPVVGGRLELEEEAVG